MGKQRDISSEQILYLLINFREEDARKESTIDIKVNEEKCKELGIFTYKIKGQNGKRMGSLFLISETHDGKDVDIIYDEYGRFIAWRNQNKDKKADFQIAQDIELDKKALERQLFMTEGLERIAGKNNMSNGTNKGGNGRDLAEKEHDKKEEKKDEKDDEKKKKNPELENLKYKVNIEENPQIRLDTRINGYYLWEILNLDKKLEGRLPKGISPASFRSGYLTIIDSKELEKRDGKKRNAKDTFAVCTYSGDIIELDEQVLIPQDMGSRDEQFIRENKRARFADGKETAKPDAYMQISGTSRWQIPDADSRFAVSENWYLSVDKNKKWLENGERPANGKIKEISFVQEEIEYGKAYSKDSMEARTRETLEYKLEDRREAPLNSKEEKQNKQLSEKDPNEARNVRKEHKEELEQVIEKLTAKYGEGYRKSIEKQVEEEHRRGKEPEEIEKDVKENIDDIENEYYVHGRSRRG